MQQQQKEQRLRKWQIKTSLSTFEMKQSTHETSKKSS
jgi:hypothetical protein